jgi:multidrug efflux pump
MASPQMTLKRLTTENYFNNIIIKNINGADIKLNQVGEAVLGPENEETVLKESGIPMIALALVPQPGTNYVAISNEFYKRLEQLKKDVPPDIKLNITLDQTKFIKRSITEVEETLIISFVLVVLVIYLFFRDWLIALRPLIDIPVALVGTFFIMYLSGFTINVLTLLGIVLATGLVVDDGIVVTENIYKKMEGGMGKYQAAKEGSKEIYFAVIATSITLAVIFLPIIFLQGFVGRLFREFGIVVAGAVLISAFVSLTLTPVLNVKLARKMAARWLALVIVLACFGIIYFIGRNIPSELAPLEDRSQFRLNVTAPEGTSFDFMDKYMDKLTKLVIDSVDEKTTILSVTAPGFTGNGAVNFGLIRVSLIDPDKRQRSQTDIVNMINRNLGRYPEGKAFSIMEQTIAVNRRGGLPVQFVIQNNDFGKISRVLPQFLDQVGKSPVFQGVDADLKFNKPELRINIDRLKASELGVSVGDISKTLQLALSNGRLGYFIKEGKQYQVIGQVVRNDRDDPTDLKNIYVRNSRNEIITMDNLVKITEETTPPTIYHFNRYKSATISAGLAPGKTMGDGIKAMNDIASKMLDESFSTSLSGSSRDFAESTGNTTFAFILALALIFLVLAAQFESFIDPLVIMITVPLAIAGAVLALWIFNQTLNIFSQIGMIMLIGLVTKNGILIVEFANQRQDAGLSKSEAVVEAATARMRPIIMTSLTMALGALPIALSLGAAATSRIPLGIVLVGGIMFSLILTLYVIPSMYSYLSRKKKKSGMEILDEQESKRA